MMTKTLKLGWLGLGLVMAACVVGQDPERGSSEVRRDPCWGAWKDQNGLCRTPSDGVYPDSCCEEHLCDATAQDSGCEPDEVCEPGVCQHWCMAGDPACCEPDVCVPAPEPVCHPVLCDLWCEHGFKTDENGCEICSCNEPEPEPHDCGGFAGLTCEQDQYCDFDLNAMCGFADQMGTCRPLPEICTEQYAPVCGCDGRTYGNECEANRAGTSIRSQGACARQDCRDSGCDDGENCSYCWGNWACIPDGAMC